MYTKFSDSMNLIIPNLYLGNMNAGFNIKYLKERNIKSVLQVCNIIENNPKDGELGIHRWIISVPDIPKTQLYQYFYYTCNWLQFQLRSGKPVLVHCMAGMSRSATIVIAYLMWEFGWSLQQAFGYVRQRRPIIYPNQGFIEQLKLWEKNLINQRRLKKIK